MEKSFSWIALAFVIMCIVAVSGVSLHFIQISPSFVLASKQPKENITLAIIFDTLQTSGKPLVDSAADKLRSNHPDLGINIKYIEIEYNYIRDQILKGLTNGTAIDLTTRSNMAW